MATSPAELKPDQFPLLMVAVGAGDAPAPRAPPRTPREIWGTSVIPGQRWREYFSTCLMTCVLFGIAFLIFYGVAAIVMLQRQGGYAVVKCNDTATTKEVFYHLITSSNEKNLLKDHSNFLINMASKYPLLKFRIYILIDDFDKSTPTMLERMTGNTICSKYHLRNRREIRFILKNPNVNISIMTLSKFMAMTPLKRKWRNIPMQYIPFYARIFSVWLYGGVGIDLNILDGKDVFSRSYLEQINQKVEAILTEHSNGISAEKYKETLMKFTANNDMRYDETDEHINPISLLNMVQKIFNETLSFFNTSFGISPFLKGDAKPAQFLPLPRTHRAKHEISAEKNIPFDSNTTVINIILSNTTALNATGDESKENFYNIYSDNDTETKIKDEGNTTMATESFVHVNNEISGMFNMDGIISKADKDKSNDTEIIFFYDVSIVPKTFYPMEPLPVRHVEDKHVPRSTEIKNKVMSQAFVVIEAEGAFVASTTTLHHFLGQVLSAGCKKLPPKYAIKNALTFCTGYNTNDPYCNSIYVL